MASAAASVLGVSVVVLPLPLTSAPWPPMEPASRLKDTPLATSTVVNGALLLQAIGAASSPKMPNVLGNVAVPASDNGATQPAARRQVQVGHRWRSLIRKPAIL